MLVFHRVLLINPVLVRSSYVTKSSTGEVKYTTIDLCNYFNAWLLILDISWAVLVRGKRSGGSVGHRVIRLYNELRQSVLDRTQPEVYSAKRVTFNQLQDLYIRRHKLIVMCDIDTEAPRYVRGLV